MFLNPSWNKSGCHEPSIKWPTMGGGSGARENSPELFQEKENVIKILKT